jgi:ribose transport system permease protein
MTPEAPPADAPSQARIADAVDVEPTTRGERAGESFARVPAAAWPLLASVVLWVVIWLIAGRGLLGIAAGALDSSSILIVVGLGQLIVITTGNANIDLSIPSTMTLAAYVSAVMLDGEAARVPIAIAATLVCGAAIGLVNAVLIRLFDLPAIIATMAVAFILDSLSLRLSEELTTGIPPGISSVLASDTLGVLNLVWIAVAVSVAGAFVLARTTWGRCLSGIGQDRRVAYFAGYRWRVGEAAAFVASGVLAALAGLLAGWDVGAEIGLGAPYLLSSVAVVVLGGTLISGGRSYVLGLWGGAVLLSLILTLVIMMGLSTAYQNITQGLLILIILGISSRARRAA